MSDCYISTDHSLLDINKIWLLLKDCFWSKNIPIEYVEKFVKHSLCFGVYEKNNNQLIGFARVITDYTTYAYICDVVIDEQYRKQGLGSQLIRAIMQHQDLNNLKTWSLRTTEESRIIYERSGFKIANTPNTLLEIDNLDIYS